jgi:prolipoprotein diacylglyceryl transferase
LGVWWYARRQGIPALAWADMAVIGLALGQAIGRWGNFFNQELYGRPTAVPWAITIEPRYRLPAYSEFATFHPAFLYESLWSLLTFALLLFLFRRRRQRLLDGDLMALYLIAYAIGRTLLEQVRLDSRAVALGPLSIQMAVATLVSLLAAAAMAAWLLWRRRRIRED